MIQNNKSEMIGATSRIILLIIIIVKIQNINNISTL